MVGSRRYSVREVTQAQKGKHCKFFLLFVDPCFVSVDVSIYPGVTAETWKVKEDFGHGRGGEY